MKTINILMMVALFSTTLIFNACNDANKEYTPAENAGYAYGVVVSQQVFPSEQMAMTPEEKNIEQFIKGFQKGMEGDEATSMQANEVLKKRFGEKVASADADAAGQVAYNLGINVISGLSTQVKIKEGSIDFGSMKTGFNDSEAGKSRMDSVTVDSVLNKFFEAYKPELEAKQKIQQEEMMKQQQAAQEAAAAQAIPNMEAGAAFLAANGKKKGVVTLPSGLQYKVIKKGTGKQATIADQVKTHYHGTTIDGNVFDSSVDRGEPATFGVGQVIKGWQEGIPLMKEGAKYEFYIPQDLAYGMQAPSAAIPAGSTLIFEVELIEVLPAK